MSTYIRAIPVVKCLVIYVTNSQWRSLDWCYCCNLSIIWWDG